PSSETTKGQRWYFTIRPNDNETFGKQQKSNEVSIINTPPVAENARIIPTSPSSSTDLVCKYDYKDADGDSEKGSIIRWYKNGVLQSDYNDQTQIPSAITKRGEKWHFTVRPADGFELGRSQTSLTVTIENNVPLVQKPQILVSENGDLIAKYLFSDIDGDTESGSEIRWYKDNVIQPLYDNLISVSANDTVKGQKWYFTVKPSDGFDFGELQSSQTITIGNTPPEIINPALTPENPSTLDSLICNYTYYDADNDLESGTQINWYKDEILQVEFNNQREIHSSKTKKGEAWYFAVTPSDGIDFGITKTSQKVIIKNTQPTINEVKILQKDTYSLVCNYKYFDLDEDNENGSEIRWFKEGILQTDYNDRKTISPKLPLKGRWYVTIKPKDGEEFGDIKSSTTLIINNMPPLVDNIRITPLSPKRGDALTAEYR
ncbi:MAG: hypothetical protein ACUVWN_12650, partial [bacterium]